MRQAEGDDGAGHPDRSVADHVVQWIHADVMKRIAALVSDGMMPSTVLTLLAIPVLYALWRGRSLSINESGAVP